MVRLDMGTQHSSPARGARRRKASRTPSGALSHAFALDGAPASDAAQARLNINTASEEELMTLEGIDRETARNVVEHRRRIGRFRRVEDLAPVRGVGAERLHALRPEICVSTRRASSRSASYDSLGSVESRATTAAPGGQVDVNTASVFELQAVHGITQEVAAAIVHRREKKGPFRQVDDLLKVKGVDKIRLHNIAMYLTVESVEDVPRVNGDIQRNILTNGYTMPRESNSQGGATAPPPRRNLAVRNGLSSSAESDLFELLSAYSPRPPAPRLDLDSAVARLACWNLHEFSYEKAANPGVREVVCRTVLENGFSIVAVQGVANVTALRAICDELNRPSLPRVREWRDKEHYWDFCMLDEHDSSLGFIYDSDGAFDVELVSLRSGPAVLRKECDVIVATFRIDELKVNLINLSMREGADMDVLDGELKELVGRSEEPSLVFVDLGDVSGAALPSGGGSLSPAVSPNARTSLGPGRRQASNVLRNARAAAGGRAGGVVARGLTHMAIPNGWSWGGPVSPYCPVWAELYVGDGAAAHL